VKSSDDQSMFMTLSQLAKYLQLADKTILRMAQRGEMPGAKIANQWRFMRPVIDDWFAAKMQTMPPAKLSPLAKAQADIFSLHELIRPELMVLNLQPGPKERVLKQLVEPLHRTKFIGDTCRLLEALVQREEMMTTAVGHGVAIPHPRKPLRGLFPEPAIVLGVCPGGTDYQAVDDKPVDIFFLICATRIEVHLQLMAKVAWLSRTDDLLARFRKAHSSKTIINILRKGLGAG